MKWVTFRYMYLRDFPTTDDWHLVLELQFYVMLGISTLGKLGTVNDGLSAVAIN